MLQLVSDLTDVASPLEKELPQKDQSVAGESKMSVHETSAVTVMLRLPTQNSQENSCARSRKVNTGHS